MEHFGVDEMDIASMMSRNLFLPTQESAEPELAALSQTSRPLLFLTETTTAPENSPPFLSATQTTAATTQKRAPRKSPTVVIPPELFLLTPGDMDAFILGSELVPGKNSTSNKEVVTVHGVNLTLANADKIVFDLRKICALDLRKVCKNMGVPGVGSTTKFDCRRILAERIKSGVASAPALAHIQKSTSSLCRIINIIFSTCFIEGLRQLNDIKLRKDHETGNMPCNYWTKVMSVYNTAKVRKD
jgi:hypothetical protein